MRGFGHNRVSRLHPLTWIVWFVIAFPSCSGGRPATYPVVGKVTFPDGSPIGVTGWVEFRPLDAESKLGARGQMERDGSFKLGTFAEADGAVAGKYAAIVVVVPHNVDIDSPFDIDSPEFKSQVVTELIDPKYRRFETSELTFTVSEDPAKNEFHIVVERPQK